MPKIFSNEKLKPEARKQILQLVDHLENLNTLLLQINDIEERARCIRSLKNCRTKVEEAVFWLNDAIDIDNRTEFPQG